MDYEYKIVWMNIPTDKKINTKDEASVYWQGYFNSLGKDGWELVQIVHKPSSVDAFSSDYAYFIKRQQLTEEVVRVCDIPKIPGGYVVTLDGKKIFDMEITSK